MGSFLLPFLKTGVILAIINCCGNIPDSKDALIILQRGFNIYDLIDINILTGKKSIYVLVLFHLEIILSHSFSVTGKM